MSDFPRKPPVPPEKRLRSGRSLLIASVILSAIAVACLLWWLVDDTRSWWAAGAGAIAAVAGVAVGARGRRIVPGDDAT